MRQRLVRRYGSSSKACAPAATSNSPTYGRVKILHPVGDGTGAS